jgi:hypothetical protein
MANKKQAVKDSEPTNKDSKMVNKGLWEKQKTRAELTAPYRAIQRKRWTQKEINAEKQAKLQKKAALQAKDNKHQQQLKDLYFQLESMDDGVNKSLPPPQHVTWSKKSHMQLAMISNQPSLSNNEHAAVASQDGPT